MLLFNRLGGTGWCDGTSACWLDIVVSDSAQSPGLLRCMAADGSAGMQRQDRTAWSTLAGEVEVAGRVGRAASATPSARPSASPLPGARQGHCTHLGVPHCVVHIHRPTCNSIAEELR